MERYTTPFPFSLHLQVMKFPRSQTFLGFPSLLPFSFKTKILLNTLFLAGIISFKTALMRSDTPHIKYASGIIFFLILFLILFFIFQRLHLIFSFFHIFFQNITHCRENTNVKKILNNFTTISSSQLHKRNKSTTT